MFVFPLHVIDVPRHPSHGVNGLLDDVVALLVRIKVLCDFLEQKKEKKKQEKKKQGATLGLDKSEQNENSKTFQAGQT